MWPATLHGETPTHTVEPVRHLDEVSAAVKALRDWCARVGHHPAQVDAGFRGTVENGQVVSTQGIGVVLPAELVMSILEELDSLQQHHDFTA